MMLERNNAMLDFDELEARITKIEAHRRHPEMYEPTVAIIVPPLKVNWRMRLKSTPVIGPALAYALRRWRHFVAPSISRRERLKRLPVLGDLAQLINALLRLPRFRVEASLRLDHLSAQMDLQQHLLGESRLMLGQQADAIAGLLRAHELDHQASEELRRLLSEDVRPKLEQQQAKLEQQQAKLEQQQAKLEQQQALIESMSLRLEQQQALHEGVRLRLEQQQALHEGVRLRLEQHQELHEGVRLRLEQQLSLIEAVKADALTCFRDLSRQFAQETVQSADSRAIQLAHTQALRSIEHRLDRFALHETEASAVAVVPEAQQFANFYVEFEDNFRGDRASVKSRLQPYLDSVREAAGGSPQARLVDIGCGRGEWLEMLQEQGYEPLGIDLNEDMVLSCRSSGLNVLHADGLAWLQAQAAGSLNMVSAFHLIEHLSFERQIALLDATLAVLAPNGVAIFETPNPENLQVGACNFYYDPTHLHPLPPAVALFMARQRGFARAEILRLNPYPEAERLPDAGEVNRRINHFLYGPQDYALIAWKQYGS